MSISRISIPFIALAFLSACAAEPDVDTVPPGADVGPEQPGDPVPIEPVPGDLPADSSDPASWVVTFSGVGPLRLGMSLEEAAAALDQESLEVSGPSPACGYVLPPAMPEGIAAMVIDEQRIARIDVMEDVTETEAGVGVGDSEARIRSLYEGRVEEEPHEYVDGSYLIVSPPGGEADRRIIFETEGETVTSFRTGLLPQVRWVEGCS